MNIYIGFFSRIITAIICVVYTYQMFNYMGALLEKRENKVFIIISPIIISFMFIAFSISNIPLPIVYIVIYSVINLFFLGAFKGTFDQIIFSGGNFVLHILALRGIVLSVMSLIEKLCIHCLLKNDAIYTISLAMTFLVSSIFILVFRRFYKDEKVKTLSKNKTRLRFLVITQSILNFALIVAFISFYYDLKIYWLSYYYLTNFILIMVVFYVIFNYCAETSVRMEGEIKLQVMERQLNNQLEDYYAQMRCMDSLRKFKHDCNNIILSIGNSLKSGDTKSTENLLHEIEKELKLNDDIYKQYSNNPLIQAILTKARNRISKDNIDFSAEVIFPKYYVLSDLDLCRVFSNIVDNAIEALMKLDKNQKRYIKVKGNYSNGWFTLTLENNFDGNIKVGRHNIRTSKHDKDNHGYGLEIVQDIVSKNNGVCIVDPDKDKKVFTLTLHIPYKNND